MRYLVLRRDDAFGDRGGKEILGVQNGRRQRPRLIFFSCEFTPALMD
jgi:hypothetical protein